MSSESRKDRRKRRWGDATENVLDTSNVGKNTSSSNGGGISVSKKPPIDGKAKALALQASIAARLAALKASKANNNTTTMKHGKKNDTDVAGGGINSRPVKKAKIYDLDMSITTPQFKEKKKEELVPKKKINPYLAHLKEEDVTSSKHKDKNLDNDANNQNKSSSRKDNFEVEELLDSRLKGGKGKMAKQRVANKKINFVTPGTYIEKAKKKHQSNVNAIQSGYRSGRKQGTYIEATEIAYVNDELKQSDYYGTNENNDARSLAPRVDTICPGNDGSTKHTMGVVPIPIPLVMEWWDLPLLPKGIRKEIVTKEGEIVMRMTKNQLQNTFQQRKTDGYSNDKDSTSSNTQQLHELQTLAEKAEKWLSVTNSKTYRLVQHPKPIIPPTLQNQEDKPKPVLHLTKKELKKQRKLRRAEKQREIQDLQSVGLLPKPEPKLTLSNYMRVLGTQAVLDPSTIEKKVQEQIQTRKKKHDQMNLERKVKAKETRDLKKKLEAEKGNNGTSDEAISIALFLVKDMSHRYHRTKVDVNAQQMQITGGVVECQANPKLVLIIAEGCEKSIKKFIRLMTVRMKWKGENFADDDDDDDEINNMNIDEKEVDNENSDSVAKQKFNPDNSCDLVWKGMSAKRMFRSFLFQSCPTSVHARKVLEAKGVAHFWDQLLVHSNRSGETFNFNLG